MIPVNSRGDAITLKRGPCHEPWWEHEMRGLLAGNAPPWGADEIVPLGQPGVVRLRLTKAMLDDFGEENPDGRSVRRSCEKFAELAPLAIAGLRHAVSILDVHDTRFVKNSVERALTSLALGLMVKITCNKGAGFPYQTTYGHEVRYHSAVFQEITTRTLAGLGFVCHIMPDHIPTAIWNTSTMGKFFCFPLSFCGTASHSESMVDGLEMMDSEGSQFLVERVEALVEIQRTLIRKVDQDGYLDLYLSARTDPRISDLLYRLTHHGMSVYEAYQRSTAADETLLERVRGLQPSVVHIDCCHGTGRQTLKEFFAKMGLSQVTERIGWMHVEERADFGNIGKALEDPATGQEKLVDMGADVTQVVERQCPGRPPVMYFPVLRTADYPGALAAMPVGHIVLHTDMDNDRLAASQILANDPETRRQLDGLGVLYNVLSAEKLQAVFVPNKFFHLLHEMNFERLTALKEKGALARDTTFVVLKTLASTPAVDTWVAKRQAEGHRIVVINTAVGFAKLANVMYRIEAEMRRNPGEDVLVNDATGTAINVGARPLILAAWEESGGIIVGITRPFKDVLGNTFLAQREKSATESIFLSLALIAKLQRAGGQADLAESLSELYTRDGVDTPIDIRFENVLIRAREASQDPEAEAVANRSKVRVFGAYLSLALASARGEVTLAETRAILGDMFGQEADAHVSAGVRGSALAQRFREVAVEALQAIQFTGDGVRFLFRGDGREWSVLFRPSGTDAKLKAYGFGQDTDRLTVDTWAFAFNVNLAQELPGSFTTRACLIDLWGNDGSKAVEKQRRMQTAWEEYGVLVDPQELTAQERERLEPRRLDRSFAPPDDHLEIVGQWVRDAGLGEFVIDLDEPQAMPQEQVRALLEAIPEEVYQKLGRAKDEVLAKER